MTPDEIKAKILEIIHLGNAKMLSVEQIASQLAQIWQTDKDDAIAAAIVKTYRVMDEDEDKDWEMNLASACEGPCCR